MTPMNKPTKATAPEPWDTWHPFEVPERAEFGGASRQVPPSQMLVARRLGSK